MFAVENISADWKESKLFSFLDDAKNLYQTNVLILINANEL